MQNSGVLRTITFRLSLAVSLAFTASTLLLFGFIYWQTTVYETSHLRRVVETGLQQLAALPPQELPNELDAWQATKPSRLMVATLFAPNGTVIKGAEMQMPVAFPADGHVHELRTNGPTLHRAIALAAAMRFPDGSTLMVQRSLGVLIELRHVVIRTLFLGVVPLALLGLAAGTLLSFRTAHRLRMMHEAIDRIMRGDLAERLPVSGSGDDLDQLTRGLNKMLDEIERLIGEVKSVGDNIAHDLRTPLARMRMRLELGRSSVKTPEAAETLIDACLVDLDFTFGLVAALLRIAELEARRRKANFAAVNLGDIVEEVAEIYAPLAAARDHTLSVQIDPSTPVFGDHDLLVEALANLVDNAIKFTPNGGKILLRLSDHHGSPVVRVIDNGPGVPPAERDLVFRRFYRADKSRRIPGHGLGLNLVCAIANLHGFHLAIEDGPGAVFALNCREQLDTETVSSSHKARRRIRLPGRWNEQKSPAGGSLA